MYIYIYISLSLYTYLSIYLSIYISLSLYIYMYICIYIYTYIYVCLSPLPPLPRPGGFARSSAPRAPTLARMIIAINNSYK